MPKYFSFFRGVVDSDDLIPLNVNRNTLQESKIIKVISKKLVSKAIEILRKLVEKDESKEEKYDEINDDTKELDINDNGGVLETENDELVVDDTNDAPTPQEVPTTTTTMAAAAEEGRGDDNGKADNTKWGGG